MRWLPTLLDPLMDCIKLKGILSISLYYVAQWQKLFKFIVSRRKIKFMFFFPPMSWVIILFRIFFRRFEPWFRQKRNRYTRWNSDVCGVSEQWVRFHNFELTIWTHYVLLLSKNYHFLYSYFFSLIFLIIGFILALDLNICIAIFKILNAYLPSHLDLA